jgi:hypothetical protein
MSAVEATLIGFIIFGIIMNIIGWTDYYRHRAHRGVNGKRQEWDTGISSIDL